MDSSSSSLILTPAIVWHAVSATVAWTVLLPLSHIIARWNRNGNDSDNDNEARPKFKFQVHRALMIIVAMLTIQAYIVALITSKSNSSPPQHPMFASALIGLILIQVLAGVLRPTPSPQSQWRRSWHLFHFLLGCFVSLFALYILQHSIWVFHIEGWLKIVVLSAVSFGSLLTLTALINASIIFVKNRSFNINDPANGGDTAQNQYEKINMEMEEIDREGQDTRQSNFVLDDEEEQI